MNRNLDRLLTGLAVAALAGLLWLAESYGSGYLVRILNMIAINITLAVSYNLINGVTGQFSLGPNAFIAIGAYVSSLLTMTSAEKQLNFILEPCAPWLLEISLPFLPAIVAGGLFAALCGFLMAFPVFRVRGDYLAMVTLGFGEVVRVVATNLQTLTNGPLGLKGIAARTTLWWSWGLALATLFIISRLVKSSYGRALKAVRQDEVAAEAMGVDAFRHKLLAFTIFAFFQGLAGGLLAHLITTIAPALFTFLLTFNLLIIIVLGGLGSTTGAVLAATAFTWGSEWLRVVEEPFSFFGLFTVPGVPGMRMVIFSILLIVVMLFAREGLMGRREFTWAWLRAKLTRSGRT